MARIRVYLKPFKEDGTYATDWTEVTNDVLVNGLSPIRQRLDVSEFNVGLIRNSAIQITLRNDHGRYSEVGKQNTLFRYKRADSQVKVTWDQADEDYIAGIVDAESFINQENTLFIGLLEDDSSTMELKTYHIKFNALGREAIFDRVIVPFAELSDGDLVSDILYACLNQTAITDLLTVDVLNIAPSYDAVVDTVAQFENKTVKEALNLLLTISNSVCYVESDTVYVKARTPSASVIKNFYGQGAEGGRENIINIDEYRSGLSRTFNFVTWQETPLNSGEADSIIRHGYKKKEVSLEGITNNTTRQDILDAIRDEFGNPKREFNLVTPIAYDVLDLLLLDRVAIDFPELVTSHSEFPIYGTAEYGVAKYPTTLAGFSLSSSEHFKIIGKETDTIKGEIKLAIREV